MLTKQIRQTFIDFFAKDNHTIISSSSLIPHNDPTLMFVNSGMVQFKNYFTGVEEPKFKRAVSSQKCIRAGGKHNDLENVGYTARHHTFFEMLGNFSFGDYFKEHAIEMSWELIHNVFKINKDKLYITIYHDDDDAYKLWRKITGFNDDKIIRISTNDNFWSMGDVGPCGPSSEIFYDHGDKYEGGLPGTHNSDGDRYVEIWNLVFMQYEQLANGKRIALPKLSIDTGMGIERVAAVLQGVNDNFAIDIFQNIIKESKNLSGDSNVDSNEFVNSHKIIADHLRSSSFLITDGVIPSNEGRGYILRRIMRRAMRHIHKLNNKNNNPKEFMMHMLVKTLVNEMGDVYKELERAEDIIINVLRDEEEKFKETLDAGMKLLDMEIKKITKGGVLGGNIAFKLYDTYGFPLDLTTDILKEYNISVNNIEFENKMKEQKNRAKNSWKGSGEKIQDNLWFEVYEKNGSTEFIGYDVESANVEIKAIIINNELVEKFELKDGDGDIEVILIFDKTPFYGESGGQVGDTGYLKKSAEEDNKYVVNYIVNDVKIYANKVFAHYVTLKNAHNIVHNTINIGIGDKFFAQIDTIRRNKIRANHSATHILHYALRSVLGKHVAQRGSLVNAEKLRFDFTHNKPLSDGELIQIENIVNSTIISNQSTLCEIMLYQKALDCGAMALFGEKYSDNVRVINIGDSVELCGGTHVSRTGDIGLLKIITEETIASGVKRIEAFTGIAALQWCHEKITVLKNVENIVKCSSNDIEQKINQMVHDKKNLEKELLNVKIHSAISPENILIKKLENPKYGTNTSLVIIKVIDPYLQLNNLKSVIEAYEGKSSKQCKDNLIIISSIVNNNMSIVVKVTIVDTLNAGDFLNAANIVKDIISRFWGKGGGNKSIAQAGDIVCDNVDKLLVCF